MDTGDETPYLGARLVELEIADEPAGWADAGFTVADDVVQVGTVRLRLAGRQGDRGDRGITGWTLSGVEVADDQIDGLPTRSRSDMVSSAPPPHPNGVIGLDHVVVLTPDLDRTIAAFEAVGLDLRRIRDTGSADAPMQQAFFRCGPVIIEVVGPTEGSGESAAAAPATWYGLAMDAVDLDETAALLGDGVGRIKQAVQQGRRITTFRHRSFDISTTLAAMDDHADRLAGQRA